MLGHACCMYFVHIYVALQNNNYTVLFLPTCYTGEEQEEVELGSNTFWREERFIVIITVLDEPALRFEERECELALLWQWQDTGRQMSQREETRRDSLNIQSPTFQNKAIL